MLHRLQKNKNNLIQHIMDNPEEKAWTNKTKKLITEYTTENIIQMTNYQAKETMKKYTNLKNWTDMRNNGKEKSKVKFYMENSLEYSGNSIKRPTYLDILTRSEASIIFKGRTRMLQVKQNYKNKYKDLVCRGCGQEEETQDHILQECIQIHEDEHTKTTINELFNNSLSTEELQKLAKKLQTAENKINNTT